MTKPLTNIFLLTDFSEGSKNAIQFAIEAFGNRVNYHVLNSFYIRAVGGTMVDLGDELEAVSQNNLNKMIAELIDNFPSIKDHLSGKIYFGTPLDAIEQHASSNPCDLIVMEIQEKLMGKVFYLEARPY